MSQNANQISQDDASTNVLKNTSSSQHNATQVNDQTSEVSPVLKLRYPDEEYEIDDMVCNNKNKNNDGERTIETCCNRRFYKNNELISKSKYRTIFRGFDNETGYEIAWSVYSLQNITHDDKARILQVLEKVKQLRHPNILTCIHYLVKKKELAIVTELITGGSIREYLKKIKQPRLIVLKNWSRKILEGTQYLHSQNFVHGKLTCESIYINSNCGDIKIGDLGIQAIPSYNTKYSETTNCKLLRSEDQTPKFDIFCFGLSFLEMILISSDISGHQTFKQICKVINNKEIDAVLQTIIDSDMRDFLSRALEFDPEKRATIQELLDHQFLKKSENDHDTIKLSEELQQIINKHQIVRRQQSKLNTGNSQMLESRDSSTANEAIMSQNHSRINNKICQLQSMKQESSSVNHEITTPRTGNAVDNASSNLQANPQFSTTINSDTQSHPSILMKQIQVKQLEESQRQGNTTSKNKQNGLMQKLRTIQTQKQLLKQPLSRQDTYRDNQPKVIKIKMNMLNQEKFQHVSFDYNLESDTPDLVAFEMSSSKKFSTQFEQDSTTYPKPKLADEVLDQCSCQESSNESNYGQQRIKNYQVSQSNASLDKDERNPACEEVIIIEERGGAQENHNQTMDEVYHQNTNNEDCPIKCNVVSNQLNFVNSINYRNKNDFNQSLNHIEQQIKVPQFSKDSSDSSSSNPLSKEKDEEQQDIKNILQDLFPNYQQHYWNDRSTWNPIQNKQFNKTVNDSFDVSFHSTDLKQIYSQSISQNETHQKLSNVYQHSPFLLDDVSVIYDSKKKELQTSQALQLSSAINQDQEHEHHNEMFFEGLSSLFLERRSSINNNMQFQFNQNAHTLSHSSDSQCKTTLKNSLKYKVMGLSNDIDTLGMGCANKGLRDMSENKSRFEIKIINDQPLTNKDLEVNTDRGTLEQDNLMTPNFQTPKLTPVQSKNDQVKLKPNDDICFYQLQTQDQNTGLHSDEFVSLSDQQKQNTQPSKRFKITNSSSNQPLSTVSEKQVMQYQFGSANLNQDAAQASLNKQKSMIINYDTNIRYLQNDQSQPHSSMVGWNNILQNHSSTNELANMLNKKNLLDEGSSHKLGVLGTLDFAMQSSCNDYFHFENTSSHDNNGEMSSKSSNFLLQNNLMGINNSKSAVNMIGLNNHHSLTSFDQPMLSNCLKRRYKKMYKQDIFVIQNAFSRIFKDNFKVKVGHFCDETEKYVQKFQEMYNVSTNGIVDNILWQQIMNEAQNIPQNISLELKRIESNDNTFGATYDNQSQTPGLLSPENVMSREHQYCISDDNQPNQIVVYGNEKLQNIKKLTESHHQSFNQQTTQQ